MIIYLSDRKINFQLKIHIQQYVDGKNKDKFIQIEAKAIISRQLEKLLGIARMYDY